MAHKENNVLLAISDTGGGHRSAANALVGTLNSQGHIKCILSDLLRATGFPGLRQAPEIYDYCCRNHQWLNKLFFEKTDSVKTIGMLTKFVYRQASPHIEQELRQINPGLSVAVHSLVTGLLVINRKTTRASWPILTVVTDLATIHASWATPGADLYLVPTEEACHALMKQGIAGSKIILTGFPIHPKFCRESFDALDTRQELGINPERFTVLLTSGGAGAGNMAEWVGEFIKNCRDKQLLVVTGRNQSLYNHLQAMKRQFDHLYVYGFIDNMETLMAASDIIISKAGPGTIMEAVAMRRPLIITEAIGVQEAGNIDYVINNRLGHFCSDPKQGCQLINRHAAMDKFTFSAVKSLPFDGSLRIADIIRQYLDSGTARPNSESSGGVSLGA